MIIFIKVPITFYIGNIYGDKKGCGFAGNVYDKDGISPTIMTNGGGNRQPMIFECCNQERKYGNKRVQSLVDSGKISGHEVQFLDAYNQTVSDICGTIKTTIDSSCLSFISEPINQALIIKQATKKGYIEIPPGGVFDASYPESLTRRGRVQQNGYISPTLTSQGEPPCYFGGVTNETINNYRIRKLTPRECFRLMGVSEEDIDKIQSSGISNTQQYKMAGNSIVVDVLYHIFRKMFVDTKDENKQLSLF